MTETSQVKKDFVPKKLKKGVKSNLKKIILALKEIGKGFLAAIGVYFLPIFALLVYLTKEGVLNGKKQR